jgi:hypothetical protein
MGVPNLTGQLKDLNLTPFNPAHNSLLCGFLFFSSAGPKDKIAFATLKIKHLPQFLKECCVPQYLFCV